MTSPVCAPDQDSASQWSTYETSIGSSQHIELSSGNSTELNTGTRLRICTAGATEKVVLEYGEAFFRAAQKPLRVNIGNLIVHADNASFSVRNHGGGKAEVTGVDGPVRVGFVSPNTAESPSIARSPVLVLHAGQIATIRDGSVSYRTVGKTYLQRKLMWRYGMLEFVNEPMEEIAAEFNRYSRTKLVIDDDSVRRLRLGGRFSEYDLKTFIATVCRVFPLRSYMRQTDSGPVVGLGLKQTIKSKDTTSPATP